MWLCADLSCNVLIECRLGRLISDIAVMSFIQSRSKQVFVVVVSNNFASCAEAFDGCLRKFTIFLYSPSKAEGSIEKESHPDKVVISVV